MSDLITLPEYKNYKGLIKPDHDNKLNLLIKAASNLITSYIGYSLVNNGPIEEYFNLDYDTTEIYPKRYPINSINSITEIDRSYYDSTVHLPLTEDVEYRLGDGVIYRIPGPNLWSTWAKGYNSIILNYTPGYASIPDEVKLATIELVDYYNSESYKESKSILGTSIVNTPSKEAEIPGYIRILLDYYKNE